MFSSQRPLQRVYHSRLCILCLGKSYGQERLEAACGRALVLGMHRYKSIESILKDGLDRKLLPEQLLELDIPEEHDNILGPSYYH